MRRSPRIATALLGLGLLLPGCRVPAAAHAAVPPLPPDSEPGWFGDDSAIAHGRLKRVLLVYFRADAGQRQRQQAVDLVGGRVVGGAPSSPGGDGAYYIYVPGTDVDTALWRAVRQLRQLPQVDYAWEAAVGTTSMGPFRLRRPPEPPPSALRRPPN